MQAVTKTGLTATLILLSCVMGRELSADGISGSGRVRAAIDRFGSVVIGGVHYDTSRAVIRINGTPADEHDLKVGQLVLIRGDVDAAEAGSVDYTDTVRGAVRGLQVHDAGMQHLTFSVMNQQVLTSNRTWFYGGNASDLTVGGEVAVSGHRDVDGSIIATAVSLGTFDDQIVTGSVTRLGFVGRGFRVDGLRVDTRMASMPSNPIEVGMQVFVRGGYQGGRLIASDVQVIDLQPSTGAPAIIEGVLQSRAGVWYLGGQALQLMPELRFRKGDQNDLVSGAIARVRGRLGTNGVLRAIEMEFKRVGTSRIDGRVSWFEPHTRTLTIDGVQLRLDDDVTMRDDRDDDRWFAPESLMTDDAVSAIVEERNGRFYVRSLARKPRARRMHRSRVQEVSWLGDVKVLGRNVREWYDAETIRVDGKIVSLWRLQRMLRRGHDVEMTWDESGRLQTIHVFTEIAKRPLLGRRHRR